MALLDMIHSFYLLECTRRLTVEGLGDGSLRGVAVGNRRPQDAAKPEQHTGLLRIVESIRAILCPPGINKMHPRRNASCPTRILCPRSMACNGATRKRAGRLGK